MSNNDSITERRLRPIYNAMDVCNFKKAIHEADKLLKKQPKFYCAKALKALALHKLDRVSECCQLVDSLAALELTDDNTLQALTFCYKDMNQEEKICDLYKVVLKKEPKNEEALCHLFMAYVRILSYKEQHRTAVQLYKLFPKNPYYFWVVMSLLMQHSEGMSTEGVSLRLATKMCEKMVNEGKFMVAAEVQLYLMVLESKEDYEAALVVLDGPLAKFLNTPGLADSRRLVYMEKMQLWSRLAAECQRLIPIQPGQWIYYETFLRATYKATLCVASAETNTERIDGLCPDPAPDIPANSNPSAVRADPLCVSRVQTCSETACDCLNTESKHECQFVDAISSSLNHISHSTSSGTTTTDSISESTNQRRSSCSGVCEDSNPPLPAAGELEGCTCCMVQRVLSAHRRASAFLLGVRQQTDIQERAPSLALLHDWVTLIRGTGPHHRPRVQHQTGLVSCVLDYVDRYGDKSCCFEDVRVCLALVPAPMRVSLLHQCHRKITFNSRSSPTTIYDLSRHLTWLQLCMFYGSGCCPPSVPATPSMCSLCALVSQLQQPTKRLSLVQRLRDWHSDTESLCPDSLLDTDIRPNDMYLVLSVYLLHEQWLASGDPQHLLQALTLLHHARQLSPANFHFKLLQIYCYSVMGAVGAAVDTWHSLDLKSIQLDTLSHVCIDALLTQAEWSCAQEHLTATNKFFSGIFRDTSDTLISAYKVGSFSQVPEFISLRRRLSQSVYRLSAAVNKCLLYIVSSQPTSHHELSTMLKSMDLKSARVHADQSEEDGGVQWHELCDNRDFSVLPIFSDCEGARRRAAQNISHKINVEVVRFRHTALRVLLAAMLVYPAESDLAATVLCALADRLGMHQTAGADSLLPTAGEEAFLPSAIGCRLLLPSSRVPPPSAVGMLRLLARYVAACLRLSGQQEDAAVSACCRAGELVRLMFDQLDWTAGGSDTPAVLLERVSLAADMCAMAVVLCGAARAALAPTVQEPESKASRRRQRRAAAAVRQEDTAGSTPDSPQPASESATDLLAVHNAVTSRLVNLCERQLHQLLVLESRFHQLQLSWRVQRLQGPSCGADLALLAAGERVSANLSDGYRRTLATLRNTLKHKLSYLSTCRL